MRSSPKDSFLRENAVCKQSHREQPAFPGAVHLTGDKYRLTLISEGSCPTLPRR